MGVYKYNVKYHGVIYKAGEFVPDEPVQEPQPEKVAEPVIEEKPVVKPKGRPRKKQ